MFNLRTLHEDARNTNSVVCLDPIHKSNRMFEGLITVCNKFVGFILAFDDDTFPRDPPAIILTGADQMIPVIITKPSYTETMNSTDFLALVSQSIHDAFKLYRTGISADNQLNNFDQIQPAYKLQKVDLSSNHMTISPLALSNQFVPDGMKAVVTTTFFADGTKPHLTETLYVKKRLVSKGAIHSLAAVENTSADIEESKADIQQPKRKRRFRLCLFACPDRQ